MEVQVERKVESVQERMKRLGKYENIAYFTVKRKLPYEFKRKYAEKRVEEFMSACIDRGLEAHVSVGGLDSIVLYTFIRSLGYIVPGVSVSFIENRSNQDVHKSLGLIRITSSKKDDGKRYNKFNVIEEFGFPVLSKEIAGKIELLANPTDDNATVRHAIITGETGEYGGWQNDSRMRLSNIWLEKFGGLDKEGEALGYKKPNFKVSAKCCYYLKEKSSDEWAKNNNSVPFMGLMASEGGRRAKSLMINGCNYFGKSTIRSAPFAIFERDDIMRLALEMDEYYRANKEMFKREGIKNAKRRGDFKYAQMLEHWKQTESIIPTVYGEIKPDCNGCLNTTGEKRTGCELCGFGIHLEGRPHRFDRLYHKNKKMWDKIMFDIATDEETGERFGWARVLEYIGVGWEPHMMDGKEQLKGQMNIFDFI